MSAIDRTMGDARAEILNLLHRYAEAVDTGRFEVLDELFAHATLRTALGTNPPGPPMAGIGTGERYRTSIILYEDGTPRTRHLVSNQIVEINEVAGTATARSYNTTLQQAPGRGVEIIATAAYEDSFELAGGAWRFTERIIRHASIDGLNRDFIGDMSRHTTHVVSDSPAR